MLTRLNSFRVYTSSVFYILKQHQSPISVFSICHLFKALSADSVRTGAYASSAFTSVSRYPTAAWARGNNAWHTVQVLVKSHRVSCHPWGLRTSPSNPPTPSSTPVTSSWRTAPAGASQTRFHPLLLQPRIAGQRVNILFKIGFFILLSLISIVEERFRSREVGIQD